MTTPSTARHRVLGGLLATLLAAGSLAACAQGQPAVDAGPAAADPTGSGSRAPAPATSDTTDDGSGQAGSEDDGGPTTDPSAPVSGATPSGTTEPSEPTDPAEPSPPAPTQSSGLEMPEPDDVETEDVTLSELVEPVRDVPLVSRPLPANASAQGRLVAAFPVFLRPTTGSAVQTSSLTGSGSRLQVALVATAQASSQQVLRSFRTRLVRRGMRELAAPPATAGAAAVAFGRGPSRLTITVQPEGGRTTYTVFGVLQAED